MPKTVYRISNFAETYLSKSITRWKMKTPAWFKCPTDSIEVVHLIHSHPDGLAHLGAWERIQSFAVRNWKTGGFFIVQDRPMTTQEIAVHCGLATYVPIVEVMLERVENLGWVEKVVLERFEMDLETFRERFVSGVDKTRLDKIRLDNGCFTNIQQTDLDKWSETYPNLDVPHELKKMEAWLDANPRNYKQWKRFITNWLNRSKPNGPPPISANSGWLKDLPTN
jgi:hypothetical protein